MDSDFPSMGKSVSIVAVYTAPLDNQCYYCNHTCLVHLFLFTSHKKFFLKSFHCHMSALKIYKNILWPFYFIFVGLKTLTQTCLLLPGVEM